jgi:hypothetical protein
MHIKLNINNINYMHIDTSYQVVIINIVNIQRSNKTTSTF